MTRDINDETESNCTVITAEDRFDPSISSPSPSVGGGDYLDSTYYDDDELPGFGSDSGVVKPASTLPLSKKAFPPALPVVKRTKAAPWSPVSSDQGDQEDQKYQGFEG
ncbi:hypothetical protein BPAE_0480g00010 [Botrytis paeoniae]|uniref:Uncharacterized protein n=1 Tax=Botrytis paeoniae TaxID=278948 RepID=A0A4Z1EW41_9HELO|nr:hypothetical protein BPAE_0480g00010 [Botrytis paeoniae]